jgi:hypothetical protein
MKHENHHHDHLDGAFGKHDGNWMFWGKEAPVTAWAYEQGRCTYDAARALSWDVPGHRLRKELALKKRKLAVSHPMLVSFCQQFAMADVSPWIFQQTSLHSSA